MMMDDERKKIIFSEGWSDCRCVCGQGLLSHIQKNTGVMKKCGEEQLLSHLALFLYESLGEEYPEVLGSILGAMKGIVNVIGILLISAMVLSLFVQ
jgi:hypothetical protein